MNVNKLLSVALSCAIIALGTSCAKKTPDTIRVVLDWTPNTNHTGMYVALENGYYKDAGLNVEILQPPEDGALSLVAAGNAEFGVDFQESMGPALASSDALPVVAVAAIINHNTSGIISLKDSGIISPKDLAGKRVSAWESPLFEAMLRTVVENDGGTQAVEMVPISIMDVFSALQTDIDAVWIYYGWDGIATERIIDTNYFAFSDVNPVFDYYTPVLVTNSDFAAQNPETVKKFMAATEKGYRQAIESPDIAAGILCKNVPELDPELVLASQKYLAGQYQADAPRWGEIDPGRWDAFYGWMFEQGLLEKDIRGTGFTNEFLP